MAMATLFGTNRARCLLFARQAALKMLFAVFLSIISTAYHLLSGSRAARLLLN